MKAQDPVALLASAAAMTRWTQLPQAVQSQAIDLVCDTLAVIAAGTTHHSHQRIAAIMHSKGLCTRLDTAQPADLLNAAFINAAATTVWQLQDGHRMAKGHPASHLVPALWALAEASGAGGEAFLSAFVAGYETGARIGLALGGLQPLIHDVGTWSSIGTAAGAAHLLSNGNADVIQRAINACASLVPTFDNETVTQGASVHHLAIGIAAQNAVIAAQSAVARLTTLPDTLGRYFAPRVGVNFDLAQLKNGISSDARWSKFELLNAYFKVHPTCAHLHGLNDAVDWILSEHKPNAADIEGVRIDLYQAALRYDVDIPTCDLSMRFSARATAAFALINMGLNWQTFTFEQVETPAVQSMMQRIHVHHDTALNSFYPEGRPATVTVQMRDGQTFKKRVIKPLGDCTNPMSRAQKRAKAQSLFKARYGQYAAEIMCQVERLESDAALGILSGLLRMPG